LGFRGEVWNGERRIGPLAVARRIGGEGFSSPMSQRWDHMGNSNRSSGLSDAVVTLWEDDFPSQSVRDVKEACTFIEVCEGGAETVRDLPENCSSGREALEVAREMFAAFPLKERGNEAIEVGTWVIEFRRQPKDWTEEIQKDIENRAFRKAHGFR
jgi:hypothetical protein